MIIRWNALTLFLHFFWTGDRILSRLTDSRSSNFMNDLLLGRSDSAVSLLQFFSMFPICWVRLALFLIVDVSQLELVVEFVEELSFELSSAEEYSCLTGRIAEVTPIPPPPPPSAVAIIILSISCHIYKKDNNSI